MEDLGAWGTLIHEKNLKSKISCQTPFKRIGIGKTAVRRGTEGHDREGTDGQDGTEGYILNRIIRVQTQTQRGLKGKMLVYNKKTTLDP
jgi:hypothetical protein